MLFNQNLQKLLECKSSNNESHFAQEPIFLPCGFSVCKSCYKSIVKCSQCRTEHAIDYDSLKTNNLIKDMIRNQVKELNSITDIKTEKLNFKIEGNSFVLNKLK